MSKRPGPPMAYRVARAIVYLLMKPWLRFEMHGLENVPDDGPCLLAANHVSFLDPPLLATGIPRRHLRFVARDTLFKPPLGSRFFNAIEAIPISRERGDLAAMKSVLKALKQGSCVALFPEGTRSHDGRLQSAKRGIGFIVSKAGVPVVPLYLAGTGRALPRGAAWVRPAKVHIYIGAPITPEAIGGLAGEKDIYGQLAALVMTRIGALNPAGAENPGLG